jgi:hypothetical protein
MSSGHHGANQPAEPPHDPHLGPDRFEFRAARWPISICSARHDKAPDDGISTRSTPARRKIAMSWK